MQKSVNKELKKEILKQGLFYLGMRGNLGGYYDPP